MTLIAIILDRYYFGRRKMIRLTIFVMVVMVVPCFCSDNMFKGNRSLVGGDTVRDCQLGLLGTKDGTCNCREDKPFFHVLNNETFGCTTFQKVCQGKHYFLFFLTRFHFLFFFKIVLQRWTL